LKFLPQVIKTEEEVKINQVNVSRMNKTVLTSFTILCLLCTVLLIGLKIFVKGSSELPVHNIDTGLDYATIQEAIDAVETLDEHTILVDVGTYHELLTINKSISLIGENRSTTFITACINGDIKGAVITVTAPNVKISNFTVRLGEELITLLSSNNIIDSNIILCARFGEESGILLKNSSCNTIRNNIVGDVAYGIYLYFSSGNTINGNTIYGSGCCLYMRHSNDTTVENNTISGGGAGIRMEYSNRNNFTANALSCAGNFLLHRSCTENYITSNVIKGGIDGLQLNGSNSNKISGNVITSLSYYGSGIFLSLSHNNVIIENTLANNDGAGIHLANSDENIFRNNNVTANRDGVKLSDSSNVSVSGNNITNNSWAGIWLSNTVNCSISGNNVNIHDNGIRLANSYDNRIFHNSFVNNVLQVFTLDSVNTWDDGIEGNYWSNYTGIDLNFDGIGDIPHIIDADNIDGYPLMSMFSSFNTTLGKHVNVISNSTIEGFEYLESDSTIKMYVSGQEGFGFCRVSIPHVLMNVSSISVVIDDGLTPVLYPNYTLYDNGTRRWIYFSYEHSVLEIIIIPEFPSFLILSLFMIATLLSVIVYKREHQTRNKKREV